MAYEFRREPPGATALCKICAKQIPKGEPAILLDTWVTNASGRLFFHPDCFPEKGDIK